MSTLQSIADKNGGSASSNAATGRLGNQIEFGAPIHLFRLKKGTIIPKETELTKAYLNNLTKQNIMTPIVDAASSEDVSSEDSMATNTRGIERLNLQGLPKYRFIYEEGHEFYRQLARLRGFKNSDFIVGDEFGNLKIAINSDGDFTGFSVGQVLPEKTKDKMLGGDGESKAVSVQFINRKQWDEDYVVIKNEELGFDLIEIQGSNPVNLAYTTVPSNSDTSLVVSAKLSADNFTAVEGLAQGDFLVTVDNVTATIASVTEVSGVYTITIPAVSTGENVSVMLYDSANNVNNVLLGDILYASDELLTTI